MQEEKQMQLKAQLQEGTLLLRVKGELDHHAAQTLMRDIGRKIDETLPRKAILDLEGLSFMDSSGIAVMLNFHKRMQEINGYAQMINAQSQPMKVLKASGLTKILNIKEKVA